MKNIDIPKLFDVIVSKDFVNGERIDDQCIILLGPNDKGNAYDPTRAQACFVVESTDIQEPHCLYGGENQVLYKVRRLNNDQTYDAGGEVILFKTGDVCEINVVGSMKPGQNC